MPRGNILGRDLRVDCRCRGGEVVENFHVIVGGQLFPELGKHLLNAQSEALCVVWQAAWYVSLFSGHYSPAPQLQQSEAVLKHGVHIEIHEEE